MTSLTGVNVIQYYQSEPQYSCSLLIVAQLGPLLNEGNLANAMVSYFVQVPGYWTKDDSGISSSLWHCRAPRQLRYNLMAH